MTTAVPAGTTPAALDRALSAFTAELGAGAVITQPAAFASTATPTPTANRTSSMPPPR